ncbi:MAG: glycosyltransferase [bacterium]|nr:glycosyltransferase [bacterium]
MADKQIDIIITTYNNSGKLIKLLESIKLQSFKDFNCFVIDDHSEDDTVKIVKEKFPWVKVIVESSNKGPSKNRNSAIKLGSCPYIVIFDDDTYLSDKSWLLKGLNQMKANEKIGQLATMIVSGYDKDILLDCGIARQGTFWGGIYHKTNKNNVFDKHLFSRRVLGACSASTIIRRDVFEKIGGFDPKYYYLCEDTDLSLRIHLSGHDVIYEPSLITHHYESEAMGRRSDFKKYLYYRNCLLLLVQNYPFKHIVKNLPEFYFSVVINLILNLILSFKEKNLTLVFKEVINFFKMHLFIMINFPSILTWRRNVDKFRTTPRQYLIDIDHELEKEIALELPLKSLIFSITNRCNASCPMCFQYESLNIKTKLLTLDEIRRMLLPLKDLKNIVLGGGEPFIRRDIDEICSILIENNYSIAITIPTNGSLVDVVYEKTKKILGYGCKYLVISLSLDGMEDYHDKNRGIDGLFEKVRECYERLVKLKHIYGDNLHIQINTCVTKKNLNQLNDLYDYIVLNMPQADWIFEPVRGSYNEEEITGLSIDEWQCLYEKIDYFDNKHSLCSYSGFKKIFKCAIETINNKTQAAPCTGGEEFISVDFEGNIYPCETLHPITNIRDIDYNLNSLVGDTQWMDALASIKRKECFCTHFCWLGDSLSRQEKLKKSCLKIREKVRGFLLV